MTPEQIEALDIARALATAGIPIFVAQPASTSTGFVLPAGWQHTVPDPSVVDRWRPGLALAMVMGHGLDLLDVDPRNGGDPSALNGATPTSYGAAFTPSGGVHSFIRSLGVRSRDNFLPGIDVKAGNAEGVGRGFAFIAPTVRVSKVTGQPVAYRWASAPDVVRLSAVLRGEVEDTSGSGLLHLIEAARSTAEKPAAATVDAPKFADLDDDTQAQVTKWVTGALESICAELKASADWPDGHTDDRGRGWEKLQADAALRLGQLARAEWNELDDAEAYTAFVQAAPTGGGWDPEDVAAKWLSQHNRLEPAAWPDFKSASERDAEAWAALGLTPVPAAPSANGTQPPAAAPAPLDSVAVAARYFGPGGQQTATMAGDVLAIGPLRKGRDNIMWSYSGGVWSPDREVVNSRLVRLLGQRYRTSFVRAVEDTVRTYADTINCDPIPDLINFGNGLLDWRAGELMPHSPDIPSTVQLAVDYDPDATCPTFEAFIEQVVPEDVVATIWELIGYLMFSGNPLHKAVMLTGHGRNGKGTFLRVVQTVLGRSNITNVSLHDLVNTRFTTASLFGKLANIAGDIDATYLENTATFKGITGGDTISAEHKGRDRFDFTPWAVPMFSANKIPASSDTSVGYLSRWLVVPFPNDFTGREDRRLDSKLNTAAELRGIAAKGVASLAGLLDRGDFMLTLSGEAAREDFIRRVDQVRTWLADCCEIRVEHPFVARTTLYEAYKFWAARDGHRAVRATEFYDRLESAGAEPAKVQGTRGFKRIKVLDDGQGRYRLPEMPAAPTAPPTADHDDQKGDSGSALPLAENAGIPDKDENLGAQGADASHPPTRVRTYEGGLENAAPAAPKAKRGPTAKAEADAQKRTETKAAIRAEKVLEASGPHIGLPATVTAQGVVAGCTIDEAAALLRGMREVTIDVETTGYSPGHALYGLRTVQLGCAAFALVLDPIEHAEVIRTALAEAEILHAHSATADLVPAALSGLVDHDEAWSRMLDTVILAKLADPQSTGSDPSLKKLAPAILGDRSLSPGADAARAALFKAGGWLTETKVTTPLERSGWAQVDSGCETMLRYAAADVIDDAQLARELPQPDPELLERERLAEAMTARVAYRGLPLDAAQVDRLYAEQEIALADASRRLTGFGVENPGSDQQVAAAIEGLGLELPRTKTGRPSVAKGVLDPYRMIEGPIGDLVRARLDYQVAENRLSLFLEGYRQAVRTGDGRVRPTVYTMEAKTGRMSCVRPNLQQVPREGGFRSCITADPGQLLISADFAGVELRVAAALSQDENLLAIVADPERDLHREIAELVWGPTAGKPERYQAKRKVFGRLYGSGLSGLMTADPPVSEAVARSIMDAMDKATPGLTEWSRQVSNAIESGRVEFPAYSGRTIYMPTDRAYAGPNYCIQGTARELLIDALMRWRQTRWGEAVLFPVHDELVVLVPEADADEATNALVECMTTDLYGVQIIAEASEPSFAWRDSE